MYVLLNYAQNSLCVCVWGGNVGPFLAWRLIIYMMLVRGDTVPLATLTSEADINGFARSFGYTQAG